MATNGYRKDLAEIVATQEKKMREQLARDLAVAEERARVVGRLKI